MNIIPHFFGSYGRNTHLCNAKYITDAVGVVNIILNSGGSSAPALEIPAVEALEVVEPELAHPKALPASSARSRRVVRTERAGENVPLGDLGSAFG